jgi:acetyl esterase/lipase
VGRAALTDGESIGHPAPEQARGAAMLDAVVLHYPVVDFRELLDQAADDPERLAGRWTTTCDFFGVTRDGDLSPVEHGSLLNATGRARYLPPLLLAHGTADDVVPLAQSELLHHAVLSAGGSSELQVVEGGGARRGRVRLAHRRRPGRRLPSSGLEQLIRRPRTFSGVFAGPGGGPSRRCPGGTVCGTRGRETAVDAGRR